MRSAYLALGLALFGAGPIMAADAPSAKVVYLDDTASLAHLKATNPDHYARARGILAAANRLCRPGDPQVYFAQYHAEAIACARSTLYTSLPPKRRLSFRLDDTRYIAMVVIEDPRARLDPVR